jgi:hypothetical protein
MVTLRIWNEGMTPDVYTIFYLVGRNWIQLSSVEIAPGKGTTAFIPRLKDTPFSKIKIVSATNPDFFRTMDVE